MKLFSFQTSIFVFLFAAQSLAFAENFCKYSRSLPTNDFSAFNFEDSSWEIYDEPILLEKNQHIWVRCRVKGKAEYRNAVLSIGTLNAYNKTFLNEHLVGSTFPNVSVPSNILVNSTKRTYAIPYTVFGDRTEHLVAFSLNALNRSKFYLDNSSISLRFIDSAKMPGIIEYLPSIMALLFLVMFLALTKGGKIDRKFNSVLIPFGILVSLQLFLNTFITYRIFYHLFLLWIKIHISNTLFLITFAIASGYQLHSVKVPKTPFLITLLLSLAVFLYPANSLDLQTANKLMWFLCFGLCFGGFYFIKLVNMYSNSIFINRNLIFIPLIFSGLITIILGLFDAYQMIGQRPIVAPMSGTGFLILYFAAILTLILNKKEDQLKALEYKQILFDLATQVAHDIRSPLLALGVLESDLKSIAEDKRIMLRQAVQRINDIANTLLQQAKSLSNKEIDGEGLTKSLDSLSSSDHANKSSNELIVPLIEEVASETRVRTKSIPKLSIEFLCGSNPDTDTSVLFACSVLNPVEFKRVISNILDNAVEAIKNRESPLIQITTALVGSTIQLQITDNGIGIPPEYIKEIGKRGFTLNKAHGSGLGLFHAKQHLAELGGSLELSSSLMKGTTVLIQLPRSTPPTWLTSEIRLSKHSRWAILDDDPTIHDVWIKRFSAPNVARLDIKLEHFFSPFDLIERSKELSFDGYLVDYDLESKAFTGLSIIERLKTQNLAYLVTGRHTDIAIRQTCVRLGIRLIPKSLADKIALLPQ